MPLIGIYRNHFFEKFIESFQKKLVLHGFTTSGLVVEVNAAYKDEFIFAFHNYSTFFPSLMMIFAGTPDTTQLAGISLITVELAAMVTLLPIVTGPMMVTPVAIYTFSSALIYP